jgi:hypothetical protein
LTNTALFVSQYIFLVSGKKNLVSCIVLHVILITIKYISIILKASSTLEEAAKTTGMGSRLVLDRPPVLKPVVTSAWASVTASAATATSAQRYCLLFWKKYVLTC